MNEEKAGAATRGEVAQAARDHYEKVSMASTDWFGVIPQAIGCWEREPELLETVEELRAALRCLLTRHLALVHSGDCGFWDPETEKEVIEARTALEGPEGSKPK